jgi:hypothetical protein
MTLRLGYFAPAALRRYDQGDALMFSVDNQRLNEEDGVACVMTAEELAKFITRLWDESRTTTVGADEIVTRELKA